MQTLRQKSLQRETEKVLSMRLRRVNKNKKLFMADQNPQQGKTYLTCQNYFHPNYFLDAAFITLQNGF